MINNEYFPNIHRVLIKNKPFHFIVTFIEYIITLITQVNLYTIKFQFEKNEEISSEFFYAKLIQKIDKLPEYSKLLITIILLIIITTYLLIYTKIAFENKYIFNIIVINIFEILIFRVLFIFILHFLLAIEGIACIIMVIISIPVISFIMYDFVLNHLYYFAPHFIVYPYDFYSSANDIFHIVEKICLSIALESPISPLNQFLYIFSFVLQISNFFYSLYIFYYKSFSVMSNIFLNKTRFAFVTSTVLVNLFLIVLGYGNYITNTFLIITINIFVGVFAFIQIFYCPYKSVYFSTDENIENLYNYYYIIDHLRNDSFLLEEKVRKHFTKCQKCNLCKNLKSYLSKKKCYKKVYKILYNKVGVLEHTLNELIHTVLTKGKEGLKYNSFYLINLMYCYYVNFNKGNYVLSFNLKLIFEYINSENKNILENHLLSTEQILLINEFLAKADNILDKMQIILTESIKKEKVKHYFELYEILFQLKSKKFKNKLYYNKNEGIINFFKYISICSMIYEEIFNVSLSSGGLSLKDNQIFLDDISHKNNNFNQLIIQLDLLSFENKIIYINGDLAKYKGKEICQLFPNTFKMQQLNMMKNKIMNSKFLSLINKDKDYFQNNNNMGKGKKNEEQFVNLQLLIFDEIDHKKYYVMLTLELNLIYPLNISKKILLTGFYSLEKNIIITLDKSTNESKKEIVLNSDETNQETEIKNYSSTEAQLITYKKEDKYYKGKKLLFITKFYVNPNCYQVYSIFHTEKQRTYKQEKILDEIQKNNLYDIESKNNFYAGAESTQNFNFMMQSQTSSTFNQISNDSQNFKKRDKGGKKENKKTQYFKYYQFGLLFFAFAILIIQIIAHFIISNTISHYNSQNMALTMLKNYYGIFNMMFASILSISCISETQNGDHCESLVDYFEDSFNFTEIRNLNLKKFIFEQNQFTCNQLSGIKQKILQVLSNSDDEILDNLLNSDILTFEISQNITKSGTKLMAFKQPNTFIDVLNHMTTGLIVMNSNNESLSEILYITNKIDYNGNWIATEEPFANVKLNGQLSQYQNYFYYMILNYQQFVQRLDIISINLVRTTGNTVISNINRIKGIIIGVLCAHIFLQILIYIYIQGYYKILAGLFNDIERKMNLKNDDISVRDMFLQKIEKLKTIISLYKQDIYQAIVDLNFIYDNYKKFVEEKNKEIAKYLKKEKFIGEKSYTLKDKKDRIKRTHISSIAANRIYLYFLLFFTVISFVIAIAFYILWDNYETINERISNLVKSHGDLSSDAYKIVNYYQLMLYNSLLIEDINRYERLNTSKGEDIFSKIYTDLEELYESKKNMQHLKHYDLDNLDQYFNFTCKTFYDLIFSTNGFAARGYNMKYKPFFISVCERANVFRSNNYKQIFSMLFEMFQIGINQVNNHTYEGLISHKKSEHYGKTTIVFLVVYYYTFEILGLKVQRQSYQKLSQLIDSYLNIGFIFYYITSLIFLLIIFFVYIYKFNRNYRQLHEMKKVFKICNKHE